MIRLPHPIVDERTAGKPLEQVYCKWIMQKGVERLRTMFAEGDIEGAVRLIRAAQDLRQMLRDTASGIVDGVNRHYYGSDAQLRRLQTEIVADADRMFEELLTHYRGDPYRSKR